MNSIVIMVFGFLSFNLYSSVMGVSVHPLESNQKVFNTEYTSRFSNGSTSGMQMRYLHAYSQNLNFDGGFGIYKENESTLFISSTYALFPDFGSQPKVALKGIYEKERNNGDNLNNFGIIPTVSKGYSFWGYPAYPYLAVPVKLSLIDSQDSYEMITSLTMGITSNVPFDGFNNVTANIEANIDIENSFSYLSFGLSMNFL